MTGEITEAELELAANIKQRMQSFVAEMGRKQYVEARRRMAGVHGGLES